MLDSYLRRLSERARPGIRKEIARLRGNLDAVTAAMTIVVNLRSTSSGGPVAHGLHHLEDELVTLRWNCNQMALYARRAVCERISKRRRREVILSAMSAIATSQRGSGPDHDRHAGASEEVRIVSEASLVDPALFEEVIVDLQPSRMAGRSVRRGSNAPSARWPGFTGLVPDYTDPPFIWRSFVVALYPEGAIVGPEGASGPEGRKAA